MTTSENQSHPLALVPDGPVAAAPAEVNETAVHQAFDEFLQQAPRPCSVGEWAASVGLQPKALRELQRFYFVNWLRCPKDARKPATLAGLSEYLGVSTVSLWKWRDEADVRTAVARGGLNGVQDLIPKAVKKVEDALDSFDALDAAKTVLKIGVSDVLKPTAQTNVAVQVNNKIDAAIQAMPFSCGHTILDHGVYSHCEGVTAAMLAAIPEIKLEDVSVVEEDA